MDISTLTDLISIGKDFLGGGDSGEGGLPKAKSYRPDFDQYKNTQIQKEIAFYEPVDNVDNAFARWFLNDPKFTELEELQYPNGFK